MVQGEMFALHKANFGLTGSIVYSSLSTAGCGPKTPKVVSKLLKSSPWVVRDLGPRGWHILENEGKVSHAAESGPGMRPGVGSRGLPMCRPQEGPTRVFLGCSAAPPRDGTQGRQLPAGFMESQVSMGHGLRDPWVIPSQLYVHCPMATLSPHRSLVAPVPPRSPRETTPPRGVGGDGKGTRHQ